MKHPKMATAVITIIVVGVLGCALGLIVLFSGVYNVSATSPHSGIVASLLDAAMGSSVEAHAEGIQAPANFEKIDPNTGVEHYRGMCEMCHGGPGIKPSEIGQGLYPPPPNLQESAGDWTPAQLYWIIKNGVKDTGMPAFGPTHSDEKLWAITAFVKKLPKMTPQQYQTMKAPPGAEEKHEEHGGADK